MKNLIKLLSIILLLSPVFIKAQDKTFLKKYAGTYHMLADGEKVTPTTDKYVLTADGKGVWTMASTANPDGTPAKGTTKITGTWTAEEGIIRLNFSIGEDKGGDLISEFKLKDGVFRAEGIFLKKAVAKGKK